MNQLHIYASRKNMQFWVTLQENWFPPHFGREILQRKTSMDFGWFQKNDL